MKDALLLVDVVNDFRHEDGEALFHIASRAAAAARPGARASPRLDPSSCMRTTIGVARDGNAPRIVGERSRKASAASSWPRSRRATQSPSC
jgi:hypothetical protein